MSTLPRGWTEARLDELGSWQGGGTPDKSNTAYWTGGSIPWISPKDMKRFHISEAEDQITEAALVGSSTNLVAENSVLLVTRSGILKHTLPVALTGRDVAINQDIKALTPHPGLNPLFIAQQIKSLGPFVLKNCTKAGTTVDSVDFERLKAVPANIPPLAEQKRIVVKLDALNAKSARARTELACIEILVSRYKQAVLSKAFSGELTREWRHDREWPVPVRLVDVAGSFAYGSAAKSQKSGSIPVLRMGNIQSGKLDWADLVYTDDKDEIEKYRLAPGDVLFNRTNSPALVGKTALYEGEREAIFAGYLIRIVAGPHLDARYLTYALNSPSGREFSWNAKTDGVSQSNISASKLKEFAFAVPPLKEQHEIVRRIESAFARIDRLAKEAERALVLVGRLDEAILAKAFRGELVPQDENDEPAERLLDRMRTEREAAPKGKRGRGRTSTAEKTARNRSASAMSKSRQDVEPKHLSRLLKSIGGRKSASELWLQSEMDIDEFYKQLRAEMDSGQIMEGPEKGELVSVNEN